MTSKDFFFKKKVRFVGVMPEKRIYVQQKWRDEGVLRTKEAYTPQGAHYTQYHRPGYWALSDGPNSSKMPICHLNHCD